MPSRTPKKRKKSTNSKVKLYLVLCCFLLIVFYVGIQFRWLVKMIQSRKPIPFGQNQDEIQVNYHPKSSNQANERTRPHIEAHNVPITLPETHPIHDHHQAPPPLPPPPAISIPTNNLPSTKLRNPQQQKAPPIPPTPIPPTQAQPIPPMPPTPPTLPTPPITTPRGPPSTTKLATFLKAGSSFPILVLTHNRPKLLEKTLTSLLQVRGVHKDRIFIAQDGHDPAVLNVVRKFGLKVDIHDNPKVNGPPWKVGAVKIARHYKWSLSRMFDVFDTETPATIVVEDDLLFSPDFLEYFHAVAPLVESDPTLWAASSWNDNGFDYLVKNPKQLKRTGFFPGLGW